VARPDTRNWEALSAGQRSRYERHARREGISPDEIRRYYESGGSMSAARGHAQTPERPERAQAQPERHREYLRSPRRGGKTMLVLTTGGVTEVPHLSKTERTRVAKHWNAVRHYLETGDTKRLYRYESKTVGDPAHELETRTNTIDFLSMTEPFDFESVYPDSDLPAAA
jgi:hypothetical protein